MSEIMLKGVSKRFADGTVAVDNVDLDIADGEFVILVGPSGCGKSTLLRMIVGLEDISSGDLTIGGKRVNEAGPKDRNLAMVFQNYALYPHLSVRENIAFPLRLAKMDKAEADERVNEAAQTLELTELLDRKPAALSGGQRQRVAMGRAIVREPNAFLFDEPLSNLDAKLRVQMRTEISRLQKRFGTTTVYVTHDQTEAMTLGDRVAVLRKGILQQVASPRELYNNPINLFVAGFIGSPSMNFLPATLKGGKLDLPFGEIPLPEEFVSRLGHDEKPVIVGIRPEDFEDADARRGTRQGPRLDASGRASTSSSGWVRSCSSTCRSPGRPAAPGRALPSSPANSTRRTCTATATRARSSPASIRRAGYARARKPSSGSTPRGCTCSTPRPATASPTSRPKTAGQSATPAEQPSAN